MKPKSIDQRNERNSYSQWISGTASAWKKIILLTSAAVFIWLISASLRHSHDQVNNLEKKIRKQSAGFARLAMIGSSYEKGLTDVELNHQAFMTEANPPEAIDLVAVSNDVSADPGSKQECKADSNQKAEDKRRATTSADPDSADSHPEKTTTTATRKSPAPSQPQKSKTIGQRHFGVGLKLSI